MAADADAPDATAAVFAPSPDLTVTLEHFDERNELHLHPGGQGYWIARLLATLGVPTCLCASFGGETGDVVRHLLEASDLDIVAVEVGAANGGYLHDRRGGERQELGRQAPEPLSRHDLDDLYTAALATGLGARVCVLGGPDLANPPLPAATYGRLAHDLRAAGVIVVADLSGEPRCAVLEDGGGIDVLKTSDADLIADGLLDEGADEDAVAAAASQLAGTPGGGALAVVVTRAERPAVVHTDDRVLTAIGPEVEPVDSRGAGDSVTAGVAAGLVWGLDFVEALRIGIAAGTLNVTRHGLATGSAEAIAAIAERVRIEPLETAGAAS